MRTARGCAKAPFHFVEIRQVLYLAQTKVFLLLVNSPFQRKKAILEDLSLKKNFIAPWNVFNCFSIFDELPHLPVLPKRPPAASAAPTAQATPAAFL